MLESFNRGGDRAAMDGSEFMKNSNFDGFVDGSMNY